MHEQRWTIAIRRQTMLVEARGWIIFFFPSLFSRGATRARPASVTKPYMQNVRNGHAVDVRMTKCRLFFRCRVRRILRGIIFVESSGVRSLELGSATSLPRMRHPLLAEREGRQGGDDQNKSRRQRHPRT